MRKMKVKCKECFGWGFFDTSNYCMVRFHDLLKEEYREYGKAYCVKCKGTGFRKVTWQYIKKRWFTWERWRPPTPEELRYCSRW